MQTCTWCTCTCTCISNDIVFVLALKVRSLKEEWIAYVAREVLRVS